MAALGERFERIYIDQASEGSPVALRVREIFPAEIIETVTSRPFPEKTGDLSAADFDRSKKLLYLTEFKGQFFKRCPGAKPGLLCCNYFVLNLGLQCDMNCTYCYLQSYINTPLLTVYTNLERALSELRQLGADLGEQRLRVGTGETVDSLSLDDLTLYSRELISFFADFKNWTLELKTKSAKVDQFLDVAHAGNVIVSWSINPQSVIDREELGTASLDERLCAAERCLKRGFPVAFHIDPMIWHEQWRESYANLVDEITRRFTPDQIPYFSLGALRFQPGQRQMMRERFGMKSLVTQAEVFASQDGKMRYDRALRSEMFDFVLERFRRHSPQWKIFLCMETPEAWTPTMDQVPHKNPEFSDLFDRKVLSAYRRTQQPPVTPLSAPLNSPANS